MGFEYFRLDLFADGEWVIADKTTGELESTLLPCGRRVILEFSCVNDLLLAYPGATLSKEE